MEVPEAPEAVEAPEEAVEVPEEAVEVPEENHFLEYHNFLVSVNNLSNLLILNSRSSSGKMGIELALNAANRGGNVDLVLGPSSLELNHSNVKIHRVESAEDMYKTVNKVFYKSDISIFAAAVSDYTPKVKLNSKIKKNDSLFSLTLEKTKDILTEMSSTKKEGQFIVGFALETDNEIDNAITKLKYKNLDLIVMNSLNNDGAGFEHDTNKITIIDKELNQIDFDLKSKKEVANDIINFIISKNE